MNTSYTSQVATGLLLLCSLQTTTQQQSTLQLYQTCAYMPIQETCLLLDWKLIIHVASFASATLSVAYARFARSLTCAWWVCSLQLLRVWLTLASLAHSHGHDEFARFSYSKCGLRSFARSLTWVWWGREGTWLHYLPPTWGDSNVRQYQNWGHPNSPFVDVILRPCLIHGTCSS